MDTGTPELHGVLKSLCFNTEWKYAVFWKLKHRARMVLTWEDGYYDSCEQLDSLGNKCSNETLANLHGGHYSHDPLGLAVAKMSYHVYTLGEGIVGQVAVTGNHQWIFVDQHVTSSCSSIEFCNGWQSQVLAGIKTIVVVAVGPLGVVQLGSLNKVNEDVKLVTHIRDIFFALKDFSVGHVSSPIQCSMKSTLSLPDFTTKSVTSETIPHCLSNLDKVVNNERPNVHFPMFPYVEKHGDSSYIYPVSGTQPKTAVEVVNKHEEIQFSTPGGDGIDKLLQPKSNVINLQHQNQMGINLIGNQMGEGVTGGWKDLGMVSEQNVPPFSINSVFNSINLCTAAFPTEKFVVDHAYFPTNPLDSTLNDRVKSESMDSYQNGMLYVSQSSDFKFHKDLERLGNQTEFGHSNPSDTPLKFSAGSELHEALGPPFLKKGIYNEREPENAEAGETIEMPDVMSSSHLTFDSGSESLLEAVVANVCHSGSDVKSDRSFCISMQSLSTTEKMPELSEQKHTVNSVDYSINQSSLVEEDIKKCLSSSEVYGAMSSKGFSSSCPSACIEQSDRSSEPAKNNKKRARPGENCRPRPRDRQLIQDRIKELRELVPSGSKCSIDSLLERTIKHMLFLQSITKHADKLSKCVESKKVAGIRDSSNYEQGSSWAVEVGSQLKVCSIIVENLNKNGQMLVEMLCEECSHFLEIAEAIRSLGLTILKGVTEEHGDKTWICFVVEGQENRIMRRMDVLWSLVQILQSKAMCS
ncbi:transcription factor bHLH155-like isoform X2 [Mangifera indica]|uniref:transcription factor bHLH155-like isoform X2 n=1 Tax=Mangifera indica TaxID=29780 RepID=UPI001CFBABFA|nr:transcription factor bHLH155-like isoform X2 [Mangifera indica]